MTLGRKLGRGRVAAATLVTGLAAATIASAAWQPSADGSGRALAATDFHAPTVTRSVLAVAGQSFGSYASQGRNVVVYADVADGANGTGIASVVADLSSVADGAGSLVLSPCTTGCTVNGLTYGWKSSATPAKAALAQGAVAYTVRGTDNGGNASVATSFPATVDNTPPSVAGAVVASNITRVGGWLDEGAAYAVYANVADAGAPAVGVGSVTANVSALTAGGAAVALSPCTSSCTIDGVSYGYKSATVNANATLASGAYTFSVTAVDRAANGATATGYPVTIDNTAPTVSASVIASSTGTAGWIRQGGAYYVYANVSDAASGVYTVKANVGTITTGQTGLSLTACTSACTVGGVTYGYKSASRTANNPLSGTPTYTLTVVDRSSNTVTTPTYSVSVDNTLPSVSGAVVATNVTAIAGWVDEGGEPYAVYANVTDAGGAVASVSANVSAVSTGQTAVALAACTSGCTIGGVTYGYKSATLTTDATLAAGARTFSVTGVDRVGNSGSASGLPVSVDNTVPAVSASVIASSVGGAGWIKQGGTYYVYANASDPGAGIFTLKANVSSITSGQTAVSLTACTSSCSVGGVTYNYKSAVLTAQNPLTGSPTYTIAPTDNASNTATLTGYSVTVDNTAPTVSITFPGATYSTGWNAGCSTASVGDVCGSASDAASGIRTVTASVRQSAGALSYWTTATSSFSSSAEVLLSTTVSGGAWNLPFAGSRMAAGSGYTIRAVATDAAGNTATASRSFTYQP
jgi:hypothetical protein